MISLTHSDYLRPADGYINATKLCNQCNKLIGHYLENETTKAFLGALSADIGIPITGKGGLIQIRRGGNDKSAQGTYVHPQVAINLAQWLSPEFAVLISKWVFEWMLAPKVSKKKEPRQFNAEEIRWLKIRESGVHDRKCFASAISRWIETNNIQGSKRKTIYADATNRVYYQVTHLTPKELMDRPLLVLGSDEDIIRNRLTDPELLQVEIREKAFAKLMCDRDYNLDPLDAVDLIHLKVLTLMGSI